MHRLEGKVHEKGERRIQGLKLLNRKVRIRLRGMLSRHAVIIVAHVLSVVPKIEANVLHGQAFVVRASHGERTRALMREVASAAGEYAKETGESAPRRLVLWLVKPKMPLPNAEGLIPSILQFLG